MKEPIRLIDLSGVREIEAALHIPGRQILPQFDDLEDRIDEVSRRIFGLSRSETEYRFRHPHAWDDQLDRVRWDSSEDYEKWELNFELDPWSDGDEDYWEANGWDIWHDDGSELRVFPYLYRQIICVIEQLLPEARLSITGNDPNPERDAEDWGRHIQGEACRFQQRKPPS
ncbi:hypothetical protein FMM02_01195 [Sphingomonas xanthus]|uniref:Uncharacterized protein n=1 Tax=Sphingomonas xanthus TaxID=2594473 RepID=A0A516IP53_9SPHN|nr:hypothetical protein FMM02_01195 [Sphingomonas xanthus]